MDVRIDSFCGSEAWCSSGRRCLKLARKAQCTSRRGGQDSGGACAAYVKRMTQQFDPTISKYMGRLGLLRRRRWKTLKNMFMCKQPTIPLSSAAEKK